MTARLAIAGGTPVRTKPVPPHKTTGTEEREAVLRVLDSGYLSLFEGNWTPDAPFSFRGGPEVQALEAEWSARYGVAHAVAVNSATSGLYAAMGATGVGPGDEVIVSPYTMSASAACAMVYNAIPVFADVRPDTYALDVDSVRARLSPRTKAIVVVHLLGHPADMDPLMALARERKLMVIEDCAQAHGATYKGRTVGTIGHFGVFSLNVNKTIQCGEGGVVTTADADLALRVQLIRNHAEVVVGQLNRANIVNMLGYNYRMTEIEAAIARVQLTRLDALNAHRLALAAYLTDRLRGCDALEPPHVAPGCTHAYYLYAMTYREDRTGVPRATFLQALKAEGVEFAGGYVQPLYLQPVYQTRQLYGEVGCPFSCPFYDGEVSYAPGLCPTAERLHARDLVTTEMVRAPLTREDMDDIVKAIEKVTANLDELRALAPGAPGKP
ncbi:MAG: DegT/DnrJ/EryC1/StrS family aminotransferase [Acidobacteriia bacterium]|nr:DegT/DnrJ/EryC1/StrS family aminotransferase [Terriglobia bacterium]